MSTTPTSKQIIHVANVANSVYKQLDAKLSELVSLTDFGAIGNNNASSVSANNQAINRSLQYMFMTGNDVYVPPGVYLCDPFVMANEAYTSQGAFIGSDRERCVFKRFSSGSTPFVTVGSSANTSFQGGVNFRNIRFDGGVKSNGATFLAYDVVRSRVESCHFSGGNIACHMLGGISVTFASCVFSDANIGVRVERFVSNAGGGFPNLITFSGGEIVDNAILGLYFDGGRMLTLNSVDVEGNGTNPNDINHGGIFVGSSVGTETSINDTYSIGLTVNGCWFEANKGYADIKSNSGITSVYGSTFFSNMTTYDMWFDNGQYIVQGVNCSFTKNSNLVEGANTTFTNLISASQIPNIAYTPSKTTIIGIKDIIVRGAAVVPVDGISRPLIQVGSAITDVSGITTILFPIQYNELPNVTFTPVDGSDSRCISVKITNLTTAFVTVSCSLILSGASTASPGGNISIQWQAIGGTSE